MSSIKQLKRAREYALQALYQWHMTQDPIDEIVLQYLTEQTAAFNTEHFQKLVKGVAVNHTALDENLAQYMPRTIASLDPIELAALRLGAYELLHCPETPYKLTINEAVDLAKKFGATDSYKFVNGVLDKISKNHQSV